METEDIRHRLTRAQPVRVTMGSPSGFHIRAIVAAEGEIVWEPRQGYDYNSDTQESVPVVEHFLLEEDWQVSPDEAEVTYELRNGKQMLARHYFPALNPPIGPAEEARINERWAEIWAFADAHKISMNVHDEVCEYALDVELGRIPAPRPPLPVPVQTDGHQLTA